MSVVPICQCRLDDYISHVLNSQHEGNGHSRVNSGTEQDYITGDKNRNITTGQKYNKELEIHFYMHGLTTDVSNPRLNPLEISRSNLFVVSRRAHNLENNNTYYLSNELYKTGSYLSIFR